MPKINCPPCPGDVMASLYRDLDDSPLSLNSSFTFACHPGVPCFNQCCRQPTILLSPYDLLSLTRHLRLTTGDFIARYTIRQLEPRANLPLLFLALTDTGCPFLAANGCTVYAHRPTACRLFPLTQGSRLTPDGLQDYYYLRRLEFCRGFIQGQEWTVAAWLADQGFPACDAPRRGWLEILLTRAQGGYPPADVQLQDFFSRTLYDLDHFRHSLLAGPELQDLDITPALRQRLSHDDLALLECATATARHQLLALRVFPAQR